MKRLLKTKKKKKNHRKEKENQVFCMLVRQISRKR